MPQSAEDDFGFVRPRSSWTRRGAGNCLPRNLINKSFLRAPLEVEEVTEVDAEPRLNGIRDLVRLAANRRQNRTADGGSEQDAATPASSSSSKANVKCHHTGRRYAVGILDSQVDSVVFDHDIDNSGPSDQVEMDEKAQAVRRLKKSVIRADGTVVDASRTTSHLIVRPSSVRKVEQELMPQKHCEAGSKRQFAWIHRPTAWENLVTYEEPPEPGVRPSHPVCAVGAVATERKRIYPDREKATGIPPPRTSKVNPSPRDLKNDAEDEFRVSDARVKKFPEMRYHDTSWLTNWHWDKDVDIDPIKKKTYSLGVPNPSWTSTREETVYHPPAGKACMLPSYEARAMTPLTAR